MIITLSNVYNKNMLMKIRHKNILQINTCSILLFASNVNMEVWQTHVLVRRRSLAGLDTIPWQDYALFLGRVRHCSWAGGHALTHNTHY